MLTGMGNIVIFHYFDDDVPISDSHPSLNAAAIEPRKVNNQKLKNPTKIKRKDGKLRKHKKNHTQNTSSSNSDHQIIGTNKHKDDRHPIAGLSCKDHGGPDDESASEMVFWSDIPSDSTYKSPFYDPEKYLTFEPDIGGWNNIRMAYETILVLAHATGRTLVLPPENKMYLLGKDSLSFNDFFHLDSIALEHEGMNIITMEQFLKKKALSGELKDKETGQVLKPPDNNTDWNGKPLKPMWDYLRKVGTYPETWNPMHCFAAIPSAKGPQAIEELQKMHDDIKASGKLPDPLIDFVDAPVPVDGETKERMREMLAGRNNICVYDTELQDTELLHFKVDHQKGARMLTHFYAFIFFQNWKQDLWSKRFVRDHIRYVDEIVCAAARIVKAVRERAKRKSASNKNGEYDSMHVRRGDFQYKNVKVGIDKIYAESKEALKDHGTIYIATDEKKKDFFLPLKAQQYDVTFLDDYKDLIQGVNPSYYGMLDQLVASRGEAFIGTWFSTLSGYVNRMRGYHSVKNNLEGHELGKLKSYYVAPIDKKYQMLKYFPVKQPIFMREFPTSWRDIDKGIDELNE